MTTVRISHPSSVVTLRERCKPSHLRSTFHEACFASPRRSADVSPAPFFFFFPRRLGLALRPSPSTFFSPRRPHALVHVRGVRRHAGRRRPRSMPSVRSRFRGRSRRLRRTRRPVRLYTYLSCLPKLRSEPAGPVAATFRRRFSSSSRSLDAERSTISRSLTSSLCRTRPSRAPCAASTRRREGREVPRAKQDEQDQPEDVPAGLLLLALGERGVGGHEHRRAGREHERARVACGFRDPRSRLPPGVVGDAQTASRVNGGRGHVEGANVHLVKRHFRHPARRRV